jgi:hypothetical protein
MGSFDCGNCKRRLIEALCVSLAVVVLGCLVAFSVRRHSCERATGMHSFWSTGDEKQKFSYLLSIKDVLVAYLSTGVKSSLSDFYIIPTIGCYWGAVWYISMECTQSHMADAWHGECCLIWPDDSRIERIDSKSSIHVKRNIIGRGLSGIFERYLGYWIEGEESLDYSAFNKDISSQLFSGRLDHDANSSNKRHELQKRGEGVFPAISSLRVHPENQLLLL